MQREVCPRSSVEPDVILGANVDGRPVAVYDIEGEVLATTDVCPHGNCLLSTSGEAIGDIVECACHGSTYDIRTGDNIDPPSSVPLTTYPVTLSNDTVFIDLPDEGGSNAEQ